MWAPRRAPAAVRRRAPPALAAGLKQRSMNWHDLARQPLGREPQLEDGRRLQEPRVRQLPHQHVRVGERVNRVAVVADDQRRLIELAALLRGRRHAPEEQPLQHRGRRLRVLAHPVEHHVRQQRAGARRAPSHLSEQPRDGGTKGQGHEQRRERDRAAEQRVVQHRHLHQQPAHALGRGRGGLQSRVRAQRRAADHRLVHLEVVEQRDRLATEGVHAVARHIRRAIGVAVTEQVEAYDAVAVRGERLRQRAVHLAREQEAGQQHHQVIARAVLVVHQAVPLEVEAPGHWIHLYEDPICPTCSGG